MIWKKYAEISSSISHITCRCIYF